MTEPRETCKKEEIVQHKVVFERKGPKARNRAEAKGEKREVRKSSMRNI